MEKFTTTIPGTHTYIFSKDLYPDTKITFVNHDYTKDKKYTQCVDCFYLVGIIESAGKTRCAYCFSIFFLSMFFDLEALTVSEKYNLQAKITTQVAKFPL